MADYANKSETFSQAVNRLLDIAGAAKILVSSVTQEPKSALPILNEMPGPVTPKTFDIVAETIKKNSIIEPASLTPNQIAQVVECYRGCSIDKVRAELDDSAYSGDDRRKILTEFSKKN